MHTSAPLPPPKVHNQSKANAKTKTKTKCVKAILLQGASSISPSPPPVMLVRSTAERKTRNAKQKLQTTPSKRVSNHRRRLLSHRKLPVERLQLSWGMGSRKGAVLVLCTVVPSFTPGTSARPIPPARRLRLKTLPTHTPVAQARPHPPPTQRVENDRRVPHSSLSMMFPLPPPA